MNLTSSYYTQVDNELEVKKMKRLMQREAARVEAQLAQKKFQTIKKHFKANGKTTALNTKESIGLIERQFDVAIKGEVRKAIQKKVEKILPKYGKIFS